MPNRVLRDWTNSERFDELSTDAEVFFTRLIMKADDFGGFYGNTKLLKAHLYPLKDFSHKKIQLWINECVSIGVIVHYQIDGKMFIRINDFGQRTRIMKSKFPEQTSECLTNDGHMTGECPTDDGLKPNRNQTETKPKIETEEDTAEAFDYTFEMFWNDYGNKTKRVKCEPKFNKLSHKDREAIRTTLPKFKLHKPFEKYTHPAPEAYLNGRRWEDEIPEQPQQKKSVADLQYDSIMSQIKENEK